MSGIQIRRMKISSVAYLMKFSRVPWLPLLRGDKHRKEFLTDIKTKIDALQNLRQKLQANVDQVKAGDFTHPYGWKASLRILGLGAETSKGMLNMNLKPHSYKFGFVIPWPEIPKIFPIIYKNLFVPLNPGKPSLFLTFLQVSNLEKSTSAVNDIIQDADRLLLGAQRPKATKGDGVSK